MKGSSWPCSAWGLCPSRSSIQAKLLNCSGRSMWRWKFGGWGAGVSFLLSSSRKGFCGRGPAKSSGTNFGVRPPSRYFGTTLQLNSILATGYRTFSRRPMKPFLRGSLATEKSFVSLLYLICEALNPYPSRCILPSLSVSNSSTCGPFNVMEGGSLVKMTSSCHLPKPDSSIKSTSFHVSAGASSYPVVFQVPADFPRRDEDELLDNLVAARALAFAAAAPALGAGWDDADPNLEVEAEPEPQPRSRAALALARAA
mmetsp:Transcript_59131/g.125350  ORF Transcript_59131/g.125350 Transcript_59131/m.125350 type:complete len:256 (+) Transcript_59131:3106-3873(+)